MDQATTQKMWEDYALCYDSLNHLTPYKQMMSRVISYIPHDAKTILNAACGTGNLEAYMHTLPHAFVHGVDASEEMLKRAKNKKINNAQFSFADLNNELPFNNESFECVVSVNTLYAINDPNKLMLQFRRVIKNGGTLIIVTPKRNCQNGLILKEHCSSEKPDEYWLNAHESEKREEALIREAISDEKIIEQMLRIGMYNRHICANRKFHFFELKDVLRIVSDAGFSVKETGFTYGKQAIFLTAVAI